MRPGMELLLAVLRGEAPRARKAPAASEWQLALDLAEAEHVLPRFASRAKTMALPPEIEPLVAEAERQSIVDAFYWTSELKGLLRAFADAAIPVIPLKGPCLAERLYGAAALRSSRDLDLLVRPADLPQAHALLTAQGFIQAAHADDYHQPWRRGATVVELHHDVENPLAFDFRIADAWSRAEPAVFQGVPILRFDGTDELLFLCLHGVRHRFERVSLVLDLNLGFMRWRPQTSERFRTETQTANNRDLLMLFELGHAMACHFDRRRIASIPVDARLKLLARRQWISLLDQQAEPMDWAEAHAFYLEMEHPGLPRLKRRIRHWRILATRLIEPDYAFAARFGLHKPWQASLLRPLRLLLRKSR